MLTLRLARPHDWAEIAELFSTSFRLLTFLPDLHTREEDQNYVRDVLMPSHRVTVAVREGRIIGFMAEKDGSIDQLYVDAGELRSGVGAALMADAKARNAVLELWCFAENHRARSFYEKHGFVAVEFTDGSGNEAKSPDVRYRWAR